jgi:hypothetical protein
MPHFPVPSVSSVAVGSRKTGPTPQISPLSVGALGDKNSDWTVSPIPLVPSLPGTSPSMSTNGTMVREMRFHSSPIEKGMTGCTFRSQRSASVVPKPLS